MEDDHESTGRASRRRFLRAGGAASIAAFAGCNSPFGGSDGSNGSGGGGGGGGSGGASGYAGQIGSGRSPFGDREIRGVSMAEMPDLSGELTLYSGRGQPLVGTLLDFVEDRYPDLTIRPKYNTANELVNLIETEGQNSPADVFFSVNAGSLGYLKEQGRTRELPGAVLDFVPSQFRDAEGQWIGTSGRARSIPFNTDRFSADDVPSDVYAFPDATQFEDRIGWAPTYSSFQAFVTAMRILQGDERTKEWLRGMMDLGVREYRDEFFVSQAVADGEIHAGFANHYYSLRVKADRPNAPLDLAFTQNDAGAIFNVAGACVLDTAEDATLAGNFVRHLLSAEAQDYFARETFEYPLVPEVDPLARLPPIDELNPPDDLDLTQLSDLEGTVDLLREVGVL